MGPGPTTVRPVAGGPRFSIGLAAVTWIATLLLGYLITIVVFALAGYLDTPTAELPPWTQVVSVSALWIPQLVGLRYVSTRYGTGRLRDDFGVRFRRMDLVGVPIGVLSQLVLLELIYWPLRTAFPDTFAKRIVEEPARNLFDRADGGWVIVLVVVVCVGAPVVEELMYRGLILRALDARLAGSLAIFFSAGWFALAHAQSVQLPGLFAFGIVLAVCVRRTGRIGMSILAHAAFNATTVALLLR
ncbi:MAG: CPBP family intramembrane glutamic endopeptidase [Ilumatobacteraceae bacterium]